MSIALALGAALVFGGADFLGGLAARRRAALAVAFATQAAGLALLLVAIPLLPTAVFTRTDLALGAFGGLFGATGVVLLFRCLARGPMSVVAPLTALAAAGLPVVAGLLQGERPGVSALAGIGIALVAVALITREGDDTPVPVLADDGHPIEPSPVRAGLPVIVSALVAGAMFGLFFVCLHGTGDDAGLHPLLAARMASVPLLGLLVATRGDGLRSALTGRGLTIVIVSGVLDMTANILFLVALRHGMLAVVSAITGLYPAGTVLLAQTVLSERLRRPQVVGLGVAAVAAVLVAV